MLFWFNFGLLEEILDKQVMNHHTSKAIATGVRAIASGIHGLLKCESYKGGNDGRSTQDFFRIPKLKYHVTHHYTPKSAVKLITLLPSLIGDFGCGEVGLTYVPED